MEDELKLKDLLNSLPKEKVRRAIIDYIKRNRLHCEYINLITELSKDYMNESNNFIERFKRDVNALYIDKQFNKRVLKDVDIDKDNWFWYVRLLRDTEDEIYPKQNYFQPTYLLKRLRPIIVKINASELDEELYTLYKIYLDLCVKYGVTEEN